MKRVRVLLPDRNSYTHPCLDWVIKDNGSLHILMELSDRESASRYTVYAAGGWWMAQDVREPREGDYDNIEQP